MRKTKQKWILTGLLMVTISLIWVSMSGPATAQPVQQDNLLTNPSFEQPFEPHLGADGGGFVAHGWRPWFYNDPGSEFDGPEFKQANIEIDPYRVRTGFDAQQYFRAWAKHLAGVYQTVNVPANSQLKFTVYGHAWSSWCKPDDKGGVKCDARNSNYGDGANYIHMKVGIDPTGGTDPFAATVVWGAERAVYDNYEIFAAEATAQGGTVTVFTYSTPDWPSAVINVYWDDAALVVVGEGSGDTGGGDSGGGNDSGGGDIGGGNAGGDNGGGSGGGGGSVQTQPPEADGSQYHVVKSGETLIGIAVAYGVTVDQIMQLNSLSNANNITVGQRLLIKEAPAGGGGDSADDGGEDTGGGGDEEETPEPPPPTQEVAENPAAETAQICLTLFEDGNEDGIRQGGEPLLANGTLNLSGVRNDTQPTDGVSEQHCFTDLTPGDYVVSVVPPTGYHTTGIERIPVTLAGGGEVALNFGATAGEGMNESSAMGEDISGSSSSSRPRRAVPLGLVIGVGVLGFLLVIGGGGVGLFILTRRRAGIEDEDEPAAPEWINVNKDQEKSSEDNDPEDE